MPWKNVYPIKVATTVQEGDSISEHLSKGRTYYIHDIDRYCTDDYNVNLALDETKKGYSIGLYVINTKLGISGYQEYWHFKKNEKKSAIKTYENIQKIVEKTTKDMTYSLQPMTGVKTQLRAALDKTDVEHKERSNVPLYNFYIADIEKAPDWRNTIYGNRYPDISSDSTLNQFWSIKDPNQTVKKKGTGRNRVTTYRYSMDMSDVLSALQKMWPDEPVSSIIQFVDKYERQGGTKEELLQKIFDPEPPKEMVMSEPKERAKDPPKQPEPFATNQTIAIPMLRSLSYAAKKAFKKIRPRAQKSDWKYIFSAKYLNRITETIENEQDIANRLIELSADGTAWTYSVLPFSHQVTFVSFQNPSKIPDEYLDLSRNKIGWKGKIVSFTPGAVHREQNRGLMND
jgi:hypothetical protein